MIRWPLFSDREAVDLPWDLTGAIAQKRRLQWIEQTIKMHSEYPAPTPRTKYSSYGMKVWLDWIAADEKLRHDKNYRSPEDRVLHTQINRPAELRFDHKFWLKWGCELVFWDKEKLIALDPNRIPRARPIDEKAPDLIQDYNVY